MAENGCDKNVSVFQSEISEKRSHNINLYFALKALVLDVMDTPYYLFHLFPASTLTKG